MLLYDILLITLGASSLAASSAPLPSRHIDYSSLHCPSDSSATLPAPNLRPRGRRIHRLLGARDRRRPARRLRRRPGLPVVPAVKHLRRRRRAAGQRVLDAGGRGLVGGGLDTTTSTEVLSLFDSPGASSVGGTGGGGGYLVSAWRYDDGVGGSGARAEHPNAFVDLGNGSTRYVSYETYYAGWITGTIALLKEQLQNQWDVQARDLKEYVENL
ncbi:hypothetical protein Hte_004896 [Hypoxylon texense]